MVGTLPDDVHTKLLNKEALGLDAVLYLEVDMIEPHQPEFARRGLGGHRRPRYVLGYIGSVRPNGTDGARAWPPFP